VFLRKKTTKQNSQPTQYEKIKSTKVILEKQIHKKNYVKNIIIIHNVLKKKTT